MANEPHMMPDTLYHYTDQQGLLGILQSKKIWATNLMYLNDQMEWRIAFDTAQELVRRAASMNPSSISLETLNAWQAGLKAFGNRPPPYYVASFSAERDHLPQWRSYGRRGPKFCIGFSAEKLMKLSQEIPGLRLERCRYEKEEVETLVEETLVEIRKGAPHGDSTIILHQAHTGIIIPGELFSIASMLKHKAFQSEHEWRFIARPTEGPLADVKFRPGDWLIKPYLEIPLTTREGSWAISEIMIGPCPDLELAEAAVGYLRWIQQPDMGTSVSRSAIPFREW